MAGTTPKPPKGPKARKPNKAEAAAHMAQMSGGEPADYEDEAARLFGDEPGFTAAHEEADSAKGWRSEQRPKGAKAIAIYLYYNEQGWLVGRIDRLERVLKTSDGLERKKKDFPTYHLTEPLDPESIPALAALADPTNWLWRYPIVLYPNVIDLADKVAKLQAAIEAIEGLPWDKAWPPVEQEVLFNLPALMKAHKDTWVWVTEGEKDALTIIKLGGVAVSAGGADKWNIRHNQHFHGRRVIVAVDNDDKGKLRGEVIRAELARVARGVRVVLMPGDNVKDVTDWVEANPGATLEGLLKIAWHKDNLILPPKADDEDAKGTKAKVAGARYNLRKREGWIDINKGLMLPLTSILNVQNALRMLQLDLRHNDMTYKIELKNSGDAIHDGDMEDEAITFVRGRIALAFGFEVNKDKLWDIVAEQAKKCAYHPVRDLLKSHSWDNVKRAETWLPTYMGAADTPYTRAIGLATLLSLVTKVFEPGYSYDILPIAEGPQGILKSTALKTLVGERWFWSAIGFFGLTTKEIMEQATGKWLLEFPELGGLRSKRDTDHVKAIMSQTIDRARLSYRRTVSEIKRQWTPFGTTNEKNYLVDEENRRFYPFKVIGKIDIEKLKQDREQLFAEAYALYQAGERPHIPRELWEEGHRQQEARKTPDVNEALIAEWTPKLGGLVKGDRAVALKEKVQDTLIMKNDDHIFVLKKKFGLLAMKNCASGSSQVKTTETKPKTFS